MIAKTRDLADGELRWGAPFEYAGAEYLRAFGLGSQQAPYRAGVQRVELRGHGIGEQRHRVAHIIAVRRGLKQRCDEPLAEIVRELREACGQAGEERARGLADLRCRRHGERQHQEHTLAEQLVA